MMLDGIKVPQAIQPYFDSKKNKLNWIMDILNFKCRNPSLGLTTKARACKGASQE
jgi:hypothetical protein